MAAAVGESDPSRRGSSLQNDVEQRKLVMAPRHSPMYPEGGIVAGPDCRHSCRMRRISLVFLVMIVAAVSSCGGSDGDSGDTVSDVGPSSSSGLDKIVVDDEVGDGSSADAASLDDSSTDAAATLSPMRVIPVVRTDGTSAAFDTVVISPTGDRVALFTGRGVGGEQLEIFDTASGESIGVIADAGAINMAWSDDGLILASDQGVLMTWDPATLTSIGDPDAKITFECPQQAQFERQANAFFSSGGGFACRVDVATGTVLTASLPDADIGRVNGATFPRPGGAEVIVEYNMDGGGVIRATLDAATLAILDSQTQDRYEVHGVGVDTVLTVGSGVAVLEPAGVEVSGVSGFSASSSGSYFLHNLEVGTIYDASSGDSVAAVSHGTSRSWSADDAMLAILSEAGIEIYALP